MWVLTSVSSGSLVTRCMGRMRKEMRGSPPHAGRFSVSRSTSRKATLLSLHGGEAGAQRTESNGWEAPRMWPSSRQLLQGTLLVDLVGAVGHVGVEVVLGVFLQDVADVLHAHLLPMTLLQCLKETARGGGVWGGAMRQGRGVHAGSMDMAAGMRPTLTY